MVEPNIEMDTRAYGASVTGRASYTVPIINAGAVVTPGTLKWNGSGASTPIEIPTSGNIWATEFWWEATGDTQICDSTDTPDAASQPYAMFVIDSNIAFSAPPTFSVYDSSSHTAVEQVVVGTSNHSSAFIKGSIGTSYDPVVQWTTPQYWNESSSSVLHGIETGTIAVPASQNGSGNNGLWGAYSYLVASTADLSVTPQYLWLAMSIPDDAATGDAVIDCVFAIDYSYT